MPEISRFYGLIIKMYFQQKEHNPPHVYVLYGDYMGSIEIESLKMAEGDLPPKALALFSSGMDKCSSSRTAKNLEHTGIYQTPAA